MRRVGIIICMAVGLLLNPDAGQAQVIVPSFESSLIPGGVGIIVGLSDEGSIGLADGRELVLDDIVLPLKPLNYNIDTDWPLGRALEDAILAFGGDRPVSLFSLPRAADRYGRSPVYLEQDGRWLQKELLRSGFARLAVEVSRAHEEFWQAEDEARRKRLGLWRHPAFKVRCAHEVRFYETGYEIIQGQVKDVAQVRNIIYLNFGDDWREDFTVRVLVKRGGNEAELSYEVLKNLEGHQIEVRGWLFAAGGPMIEATFPGQIRLTSRMTPDLITGCS